MRKLTLLRILSQIVVCSILGQLFFPIYSFACKQDGYQDFNTDELIAYTKSIVIASVKSYERSLKNRFNDIQEFDYKMNVVTVLKGDPKLKEFSLFGYESPSSKSEFYGLGFDCRPNGGFAPGEKYVIFIDSINSKAIKKIKSEKDVWLLEVEKKVNFLKKAKIRKQKFKSMEEAKREHVPALQKCQNKVLVYPPNDGFSFSRSQNASGKPTEYCDEDELMQKEKNLLNMKGSK